MARGRVAPLSAERFALQVTIEKDTHDKLRYAQALLSHQLPSGDIAQVVDRALDVLVAQLEKQKFAGDRTAAAGRAPLRLEPTLHPGAREAHGMGAGSGPVNIRRRHGTALRVAQVPGVRPCGPGGARRSGHGAGPASSLSRP